MQQCTGATRRAEGRVEGRKLRIRTICASAPLDGGAEPHDAAARDPMTYRVFVDVELSAASWVRTP